MRRRAGEAIEAMPDITSRWREVETAGSHAKQQLHQAAHARPARKMSNKMKQLWR